MCKSLNPVSPHSPASLAGLSPGCSAEEWVTPLASRPGCVAGGGWALSRPPSLAHRPSVGLAAGNEFAHQGPACWRLFSCDRRTESLSLLSPNRMAPRYPEGQRISCVVITIPPPVVLSCPRFSVVPRARPGDHALRLFQPHSSDGAFSRTSPPSHAAAARGWFLDRGLRVLSAMETTLDAFDLLKGPKTRNGQHGADQRPRGRHVRVEKNGHQPD